MARRKLFLRAVGERGLRGLYGGQGSSCRPRAARLKGVDVAATPGHFFIGDDDDGDDRGVDDWFGDDRRFQPQQPPVCDAFMDNDGGDVGDWFDEGSFLPQQPLVCDSFKLPAANGGGCLLTLQPLLCDDDGVDDWFGDDRRLQPQQPPVCDAFMDDDDGGHVGDWFDGDRRFQPPHPPVRDSFMPPAACDDDGVGDWFDDDRSFLPLLPPVCDTFMNCDDVDDFLDDGVQLKQSHGEQLKFAPNVIKGSCGDLAPPLYGFDVVKGSCGDLAPFARPRHDEARVGQQKAGAVAVREWHDEARGGRQRTVAVRDCSRQDKFYC